MSGNQSRSHRLCSQPLKNKITKNKVITTRDLCPFEPTRMLTKFHHSYSQPSSSSSSPPRPCRIKNTLHSAARVCAVGWICNPKKGKKTLFKPKRKADHTAGTATKCQIRYENEQLCVGVTATIKIFQEAMPPPLQWGGITYRRLFLGIIPANENSQLPRVRAETKHDFTFSKNGCCGRARTAEPGNAGRRALGGGDGQKTHWLSQRTNSDCTGRHLYVYS